MPRSTVGYLAEIMVPFLSNW